MKLLLLTCIRVSGRGSGGRLCVFVGRSLVLGVTSLALKAGGVHRVYRKRRRKRRRRDGSGLLEQYMTSGVTRMVVYEMVSEGE